MANLHLNFRSDSISRSVYPVVFLPDYNGWNDCRPPYRTLYFLPGYSGGGLETATFTNFALYSALYGIAIVLVDGENSFYLDDEQRGAMFSQYAGQEIVEATRALLPLSHRREDTYIGGISMGGYGALVNGLRYADTFSKIAMLSPALEMHRRQRESPALCPIRLGELEGAIGTEESLAGTYKDHLFASRQAIERGNLPEIFLGCGRQDELVLPASRRYRDAMEALGHPIAYYEAEGQHDHTFWKQALTPLCEFLNQRGGEEGMYIRTTFKSKMLMRAVQVHVLLPFHDGYPDTPAPFPTLYFLPGYSGNAEEIITCLPMRQMSAKYGIAVVIPDGENSFYSDHPERAALHGSFVEKELVEITRALFPQLSHRREDTYIGGISMGGYGAAVHGLHAHETFSKILMMSPAIEADKLFNPEDDGKEGAVPSILFDSVLGGEQAYRNSYMNPRKAIADLKAEGAEIPGMYMCCGLQDTLVYDACRSFRTYLEEQNVPMTYVEGDGLHMLPYWDEQLEGCFAFLRRG